MILSFTGKKVLEVTKYDYHDFINSGKSHKTNQGYSSVGGEGKIIVERSSKINVNCFFL